MKQLIFREDLYLSESMKTEKLDKIIKKLSKSPVLTKVYILAISSNPSDQLDIFESKYLAFHYNDGQPLVVVGLAKSHSEAVQLVQQISEDCLASRKDANIKAFLLGE